jgi:hypothetical protein
MIMDTDDPSDNEAGIPGHETMTEANSPLLPPNSTLDTEKDDNAGKQERDPNKEQHEIYVEKGNCNSSPPSMGSQRHQI